MKKTISFFASLVMLLTVQVFAFADIIQPTSDPPKNNSLFPILIIAVAVIVAALVIWKVRRQKK